MNKGVPFIVVMLLVFSCTSNTIYSKPDNLIEKEVMVDLLTQMQLANGARSAKNKDGIRKIEYMSVVFKNFGIDSARFAESNLYYSSKIDEYAAIYQEVKRNIDALNEENETLRKIRDSIKDIKRKEIREKKKNSQKKDEQLQPIGALGSE